VWESGDCLGELEDTVGLRSERSFELKGQPSRTTPDRRRLGGDVLVSAELCSAGEETEKPRNCSRVVFALQMPSVDDGSSRERCSGIAHVRPSRRETRERGSDRRIVSGRGLKSLRTGMDR